jgi:hypothetical protein
MKYKGKKIEGKNVEIIPIPRPDGDVIFIAEAVTDWDEFEKIVPEPEVPMILKPGGIKIEQTNDKNYLKKIEEHNLLRTTWIVLKSLQATSELEWETVNMKDPKTWTNYERELKESGFSPIEIGRIIKGVMAANALDEDMIDAAKADFLAIREEKGK